VIDPRPSPADESGPLAGPAEPGADPLAPPASGAAPLVLLATDDALVCIDELCLPAEATR
jgi:hypothetical protein